MSTELPRYVVRTVSGYALHPSAREVGGLKSRKPPVSYLVLDRLDCYRLIREFAPTDGRGSSTLGREPVRRQAAEKLAARLNAEYEQFLATLGNGGAAA
jgi:hypothetical protein